MNLTPVRGLLASAFMIASSFAFGACGDNDETIAPGPWYEPAEGTAERIAWDLGLVQYLNVAQPISITETKGSDVYEFDPADGPLCLRGAPFRTSIRRNDTSEDLLIFLQGGGACWSDFCLATKTAPPGVPPKGEVLDPTLERNPMRDWNVLYLPYCDGSLFIGDNDIDEDGDGSPDRFHRGLQNTSAALSVGHREFPSPNRIVLAGSSGGGYGTILASFLVRYVWPDTPIYIINDSGLGIGKEGDPSFVDQLISEFGAEKFRPTDCPDCFTDGHIIRLVDYLLSRDPNTKVAVFSAWYDSILADTFIQIGREAFAESTDAKSTEIHEAHPDQYRRFIIDDYSHTGILGNVSGVVGTDLVNGVEVPSNIMELLNELKINNLLASIGDLTLGDWLTSFINDDMDAWVDILAERTPLPTDDGSDTGDGDDTDDGDDSDDGDDTDGTP